MPNFYDFTVQGLNGSPNILAALRGKVTLAVNVASKCGYTPQYAGLEPTDPNFLQDLADVL